MLYTIFTTVVNEFTCWFVWKAIQEFPDALNETEENHIAKRTAIFASQVTMESFWVTLASVRNLVVDPLSKGAHFVPTGKVNQDPLAVSNAFLFLHHPDVCAVCSHRKHLVILFFPEVLLV